VGKFIINSNNSSGEPMKLNPLRYLSLSLFVPFLFSTVSVAADIENGERIFSANCSACHAGGNNVIIPEKTLRKKL